MITKRRSMRKSERGREVERRERGEIDRVRNKSRKEARKEEGRK